ncbi:MAG: Wzz/FepE/Etk N-terminal domain-containing protein [Burkholderiaceae bacterium]
MDTSGPTEQVQHLSIQNEDGLNMIDMIIAIGEEKKIIFIFVFIFSLVAVCISLSMPNIYTAKTTILPPQQNQSSAASALASLGGLAGLAGGALNVKSPDETYVAFLHSETIQNALISRFDLKARYKQENAVGTRETLAGNVKIEADKKTGLISIEASDKVPAFAAQMANAYVEELHKLLDRFAVTEAQQRRVFFEKLISKTKEALLLAEVTSKKAQETSGIVSLDAQTAFAIKASAELRAQIALREVQIQVASKYATTQNPDMQRLAAELSGLRSQLEKLEQGTKINPSVNDGKNDSALANLRAYREVKYQEAVLETLIKQYELARVEEAKEGPLLQQLDVATPPEKKSKPGRGKIVISSALMGLVLGLIIAFFKRTFRQSSINPTLAKNIKAVKQAWGIKSQI